MQPPISDFLSSHLKLLDLKLVLERSAKLNLDPGRGGGGGWGDRAVWANFGGVAIGSDLSS